MLFYNGDLCIIVLHQVLVDLATRRTRSAGKQILRWVAVVITPYRV